MLMAVSAQDAKAVEGAPIDVDGEGRFRLEDAPVGKLSLLVQAVFDGKTFARNVSIETRAGETSRVQIDFAAGLRMAVDIAGLGDGERGMVLLVSGKETIEEFTLQAIQRLAPRFAGQLEVLQDGSVEFEGLAPEIPYADRRDHVMFGSAFGVYCSLAVWKAARARGHDVHDVGRAVLATSFPARPLAPVEALGKFRADAEASQRDAAPNEFVFELIDGDGPELDWGMNITSCAVCHAYARCRAKRALEWQRPHMTASSGSMSSKRFRSCSIR